MSANQEAAAVPQAAKSSWTSFLNQLRNFNGDLSTMTAPPWILSSSSLTEFSTYWAEHPQVFAAPVDEDDPAKRALAVLKWFLTTLKQQYSSRNEKLGSEKKPLNPFLGELFLGTWEAGDGYKTQLISEQVSHHPPVTAYCIWNSDKDIRLQGYNGQKASVSRRIDVRQVGHAELHLGKYNEHYLITLPSLHIEGLITGSPYVELNGSSFIQSSTNYTAKIDYSGRGWLSGKKNSFTAHLWKTGDERNPLYIVEGQWTGEFTMKDCKYKNTVGTWNGKSQKTMPLIVAPIEEQDPLESRRAWRKVAEAINKGDMNATSQEKSVIENAQRELRKKERAEGTEWERIFFSRVNEYPPFHTLAEKIDASIESEKTNGVWRFDKEKAEKATSPYKEGVMPEGI